MFAETLVNTKHSTRLSPDSRSHSNTKQQEVTIVVSSVSLIAYWTEHDNRTLHELRAQWASQAMPTHLFHKRNYSRIWIDLG
jgi:hypothetical protein